MAYKYGIQYVNFYTDGSAARKVEPVHHAPKVTMPKPKKRKRKVIYVDPVAILGTMVAVCMLVMMFVGLFQLHQERQQAQIMENYVEHLTEKNQQLQQQYTSGYDLEEVERTALALGMMPQSQVPQTVVHMPAEEIPEEPVNTTFLARISAILSGLFA